MRAPSSDTVLMIVILAFAGLVALYLFAIVPAGEAAPIPGGEDIPMVCGVFTYYGNGKAESAMAIHGIPECRDCVGIGITVNPALKGRQIDIRHNGEWIGPFVVGDVGSPGHHRSHLVAEVDFQTAMAWRIAGPWWTCYKIAEES